MPESARYRLFLCLLLVLSGSIQAQDEDTASDTGAETAGAETAGAETAGAETAGAETAAAPIVDPLLALDPAAEVIDLPSVAAVALMRPSRVGTSRGTVVMIPAVRRPDPAAATNQLFGLLPDHGWQVVLLSPAPLPAIHSGPLFEDAPASTDAAPASDPAAAAEPAPSQAMSALPETMSAWSEDGVQRTRALLEALRGLGIGPVWLLGEGYGAHLAARLLATDTSVPVLGVVFISPQNPPAAPAGWPDNAALPVLDVLDLTAQPAALLRRRLLAEHNASSAYRQILVSLGNQPRQHRDTLLSRRLRGWLQHQPGV